MCATIDAVALSLGVLTSCGGESLDALTERVEALEAHHESHAAAHVDDDLRCEASKSEVEDRIRDLTSALDNAETEIERDALQERLEREQDRAVCGEIAGTDGVY